MNREDRIEALRRRMAAEGVDLLIAAPRTAGTHLTAQTPSFT